MLDTGSTRPAGKSPSVWTVSQVTEQIKQRLQASFSSIWVAGEISNLSRPASGHAYLTLKDDGAQMRAVIWRNTMARLPVELQDGMEVVCQGEIDVYLPHGSYQLIIRQIEPRGLGTLQLALRQLRQRLAAEGLFDAANKQPLPRYPRRIVVVTSPTGAALRDFLEVAGRRWPATEICILPSRVQGEAAAAEIVQGIRDAHRLRPRADVLVVTRGGGSLEDLWCFNDERVVRAIHAAKIPVVSAVGHEIDVTLSDLVADVRALTPSNAAELILPSVVDVAGHVHQLGRQMQSLLVGRAQHARTRLDSLARRRVFARPIERIHDRTRRLDECESRALRAMKHRLAQTESRFRELVGRLESLSPLAVLQRGYSLTLHAEGGTMVRDSHQLHVGDLLQTRLAQGSVMSRVETIDHDGPGTRPS